MNDGRSREPQWNRSSAGDPPRESWGGKGAPFDSAPLILLSIAFVSGRHQEPGVKFRLKMSGAPLVRINE